MHEVITDLAQLTAERLNAILRVNGHLLEGEVSALREIGRESLPNSTVLHLDVAYRGYVRLPGRLFLKLINDPDPSFGGHEIAFYQDVAPSMLTALRWDELPFVRHFDAAYSSETGRGHILLEDLSLTHGSSHPALPPSVLQCEGAVDSLASFHAFWWENPRLGQDLGTRYSEAILSDLLSQAQGNLAAWLDFMGDRVSPGRRATFERICGAWPAWRVQRLLAGRGITLVNGNTHAANFLYPRHSERDRVRIVDWQSWRVDTGTDDLAYMIAAHWYPERRARLEKLLLQRYQQRLREYGIPYTWEECWQDYKASVIRVLFFLIGGWQCANEQPGCPDSPRSPALWFDRVERATLTYEDLGCAWLLA